MNSEHFWNKRQIWGIRRWELASVLGFYFLFAMAYQLALFWTSGLEGDHLTPYILLDYLLKALVSIPIWWLLFRKLKGLPLRQKLLLHLIFLPLNVFTWQYVYYFICDQFGWGHLYGWASGWDVYIPGLFYVIQFGIFHAYEYYYQLQDQQQKAAELRELALQSELKALKAQLNPHFLYNTFNTISASVPGQLEHTREMIAQLADMFRYQLKASKVELVPLQDELDFVEKYLDLEKARFGERLQVNLQVDPEIKDTMVPPMILQPLVENAIRHGIGPKIEGGTVALIARRQNDQVYFEITDTGKGLNGKLHHNGHGLGLKNTMRRLEVMYGSQLHIQDGSEGGVKVNFEIPSL